jgi:hypothetical protein
VLKYEFVSHVGIVVLKGSRFETHEVILLYSGHIFVLLVFNFIFDSYGGWIATIAHLAEFQKDWAAEADLEDARP